MKGITRFAVGALLLAGLFATSSLASGPSHAGSAFKAVVDKRTGFISSLRNAGQSEDIEFLREGQVLGAVRVRLRSGNGSWREAAEDDCSIRSSFQLTEQQLRWDITVANSGREAIEIGSLGLPLPMNTDYTWNPDETFNRRLFRHAFIEGHGSFIFWMPSRGSGPFLLMLPEGRTHLEYFTSSATDYAFGKGQYCVYIHSKAATETSTDGTWRQPRTSCLLQPGQEAHHAFTFHWAESYDAIRQLLRQSGGVDLHVVPGMVVPRGLEARFSLGTVHPIDAIEPEFPAQTTLEPLPSPIPDTRIYRVTFERLGENLLTVRDAGERSLTLEFFVTEALETLIRKRADFIVNKQQHRDPSKWYDGLYSLWDRRMPEGTNLLGPENPGGQDIYAVSGSDDPSNSKCLLVAEKNVAFPDPAEIASLEYFVKHFVWGKHQRTDSETPYPYGIYGTDSWRQNRFTDRDPLSGGISRPGGPSACHMWRTFDYTTYFALYFDLYRIAKQNPGLMKELDAAGYLERAFGTARAYFEVPAGIRMEGGWSFTGWVYWQYTVGNFHEKYLLPLIAALEAEGKHGHAALLRSEWEKKVKYFIYDNPFPFASEMPIDSTAYESTYAAAKYALQVPLRPDTELWRDRNKNTSFSHPEIDLKRHEDFLLRQHWANLACRGVLETNYWSLGSDFRGCGSASYTLSYMSPMGGWAVLDYALHFDRSPAENLRLGYASLLSSWALMNTGDPASNYGYWTPGPLHDGAMSWGFQPRSIGDEWNPATKNLPRGAWPVCGEADHGLVAGIEAARTILFDDPLFGLFAFGGALKVDGNKYAIVPQDGVRQRFSAVLGEKRLHLSLDRDGFARDKAIGIDSELGSATFVLENRAGNAHLTTLRIAGLSPGRYRVLVDGKEAACPDLQNTETGVALEIRSEPFAQVSISRKDE